MDGSMMRALEMKHAAMGTCGGLCGGFDIWIGGCHLNRADSADLVQRKE